MGTLRRRSDGTAVALASQTEVGSQRHGKLIWVDDPHVSASHAAIRYVGAGWRLRDLRSTNGTWVNGHRVSSTEDEALEAGDVLCFGHPASEAWVLEDACPPTPFVWNAQARHQRLAEGDRIVLPEGPALVRTELGWALESDPDVPIENGATVPGAAGWELWAPSPIGTRRVPFSLDELSVVLELQGEEATLTLVQHGMSLSFGQRRPWALLYWLAEERQGNPKAPGWVSMEALEGRLSASRKLLDMWSKRARDALSAHGVQGADRIIEASGEAERRIGVGPERLFLDGERP